MKGRKPSLRWVDRFRKHHAESLVYAKSAPFDMKHAHCFNHTAIGRHFEDLQKMLRDHGPFKPQNIYNMDEKGTQMGGERKLSGLKYFYSRSDRARYKKRSADLELVTIIECVFANSEALTPGFIFSGTVFEKTWSDAIKGRPWPS